MTVKICSGKSKGEEVALPSGFSSTNSVSPSGQSVNVTSAPDGVSFVTTPVAVVPSGSFTVIVMPRWNPNPLISNRTNPSPRSSSTISSIMGLVGTFSIPTRLPFLSYVYVVV